MLFKSKDHVIQTNTYFNLCFPSIRKKFLYQRHDQKKEWLSLFLLIWNSWDVNKSADITDLSNKKLQMYIFSFLKAHFQVWDNFWQLRFLLIMMKDAFHFTLKALFVLKICIFDLTFRSCRKRVWLERYGQFQNLWRPRLVNKQLQ